MTGPPGVRPVGYRCRWSATSGDCLVCVQQEGANVPTCYHAHGSINRMSNTLPTKAAAPTTQRSSELEQPPPPGGFLFHHLLYLLAPLAVELLVHLAQVLVGDMRIHLRGGYVGVPEERLHTA